MESELLFNGPDSNTESHYNELFDSLPCAIYGCDANGLITFYNKAAVELWGRSPNIGTDMWCGSYKSYRPDHSPLPPAECPMALALKHGKAIPGQEIIIERPDGSRLNVIPHPKPLYNSYGKIYGAVNTLVDITASKKNEEVTASAIRKSESNLRAIFNNSKDGYLLIDKSFSILTFNHVAARLYKEITGNSLKEGDSILYTVPLPYREYMQEALQRVLIGHSFERQSKHIAINGKEFWVRGYYNPVKNENGEITGICIGSSDITDQVMAMESVSRLAAIVESSEDAIISQNLEGKITSWNEAAERIYGYSSEEMIGQPIDRLISPDRVIEEKELLEQIKTSGHINHFVTRHISRSGVPLDMAISVSTIKNSDGRISGIAKIARDITDQKYIFDKMQENEERLRMASEAAEFGTWDLNLVSGQSIPSLTHKRILGYPVSVEWQLQKYLDLIHPDDRDIHETAYTNALVTGKLSYEIRIIRPDQSLRWIRVKGKTIYNADHKPVRMIGTSLDITDQKLKDDALRESEERFRIVADTAPVMIWMTNASRDCIFLNKGWTEFAGMDYKSGLNDGWKSIVHPDDIDATSVAFLSAHADHSEYSHELRLKRKDGEYRWIYDYAVPRFHDNKFMGYVGSCVDITDTKIAREKLEEEVVKRTSELVQKNAQLQQQNQFIEEIIDASVDLIGVYDAQGRIITVNKKTCELYGFSKDEVIGKLCTEVFPVLKDSHVFSDLKRAIKGEYVTRTHKSSVTGMFTENYLIPLQDDQDTVYAVLAIAHDITEIIESTEKLKTANQELKRKNYELEQFAYVASHDLQEPLRKIRVFSELLGNNLNDKDLARLYFTKIQSSAHRMSVLIKDVLDYSRLSQTEEHYSDVNLDQVLDNVLSDFELMIEQKRATVKRTKLPVIYCIPMQMNQLFSNLVSNALKFSSADPVIDISCEVIMKIAQKEFIHLDPTQKYIKITFRDNGIGFDQKYSDHIFTIFHRLNSKSEFSGTGIGLALCKKIVENHKGHIYASGQLNQGAAFHIVLPL
jgi:PAS domain S-box-containing protein